MISMVEYAHQCLLNYTPIHRGVDFTMGNGYDTEFLVKHCDEVYAFDIQEEALKHTKERLGENQAHLILDGHQNIDCYMEEFDVGIMNLGYLPMASHQVTTLLPTSQEAIIKAIAMMKKAFVIVVYPGHDEGAKESQWIETYVSQLDTHQYNVSCFRMMNKAKAPYVIEIEKR